MAVYSEDRQTLICQGTGTVPVPGSMSSYGWYGHTVASGLSESGDIVDGNYTIAVAFSSDSTMNIGGVGESQCGKYDNSINRALNGYGSTLPTGNGDNYKYSLKVGVQ